MTVLDQYVDRLPDPQAALDIFQGEWTSQLPASLAGYQAGSAPLFDDARIQWCLPHIGGVRDKTVLELGPLEGGHTYLLEQSGAAEITAIEANTHAYLKCLIVKELLNLQRAHFLCGDFVKYLRAVRRRFDLCLASGVLYHMDNPIELIDLIARTTDRVIIWTHYYDQAAIEARAHPAVRFSAGQQAVYAGFAHTLYRQEYQQALELASFCGGSRPYSHWISREDLLGALRHFGFDDIRVSFDQTTHPIGPSCVVVAMRSQAPGTDQHTAPVIRYIPEPAKTWRGLLAEAQRHYQLGGVKTLGHETVTFVKRRLRRRI